MKTLRRIWHFFAGHPESDIDHFLEGGLECEGCKKQGKRL